MMDDSARMLTHISSDQSASFDRSEFWRHYTACMITQAPESQENLLRCCDEITGWVVNGLSMLMQYAFTDEEWRELYGLVKIVLQLWQDLKCQRGYYELDTVVKPNDVFAPESMDDFKNFMETSPDLDTRDTVTATVLVARGFVRKPFKGSEEVMTGISKTRVVLEIEAVF